mgnify:CR=1 FL=1
MLHNFLPVNDGELLGLRFSTNGGSTYDAGASDYSLVSLADSSLATADNRQGGYAAVWLGGGNIDSLASSGGLNGSVHLYGTTNASARTHCSFESSSVNSDISSIWSTFGHASRVTAQDTDAIRLIFNTGNIASGSWALYGFN